MRFLKPETPPRDGEELGRESDPELSPPSPVSHETRTISLPVWAIAVALVLVAGVILWPTLHRQLLQLSATPPVSRVALPDYKDVSRLSLSYSTIAPSSAAMISNFEGSDHWEGTGIDRTDLSTPFEGQSSLGLRSVNQAPARVTLTKNLDLSGMRLFEMYVRVAEPSSVKAMRVSFLSQTAPKRGFEFPLTQFPLTAGVNGWFPARMPRDRFEAFGGATPVTWSDIGSVSITFVARPGIEAKANLDFLRGEGPGSLYNADWKVADPQTIGVVPSAHGIGLLFRNIAGSFATIAQVGDAKDFVLTAKVTPLTSGRGGLLLRGNLAGPSGYSFVIGGVGASNWQLMQTDENTTTLVSEGTITDLTYRDDATYWLRATVKGNGMRLALSRDGEAFITVVSISDVGFPFGNVGLAVWDSAALYVAHKIDYERI